MKKILYVFCLFTLIACEHTDGIEGSWNRTEKAINGQEYYQYSLMFNQDGTYISETENKDIRNASFILLKENGKYLFDGEYLYLYERNVGPDLKFKVNLTHTRLSIFYNCGVTTYNR